jgi:hypothetical protein
MRRAALKLATPLAALTLVVALLAGCGGGGTTTVTVERTVREPVPAANASAGGATETAARREAAEKKAEEAQEPSRIVHLETFRSPSGNIGCVMFDGGARCDIRKRDWSPPVRPANCSKEVDFGQGLQVSSHGEASFVCAGDTALDPTASALAYGTASRIGASECISRTGGVTCVNQAGHGFFISIQSYRIF